MLRLAVFDLDGTLKEANDPYVYLHRHLGTEEASAVFTTRGLSGEIPYEEWLRLDVSLWTGTPRATLERFLRKNPYLPGARETIAALVEHGVRVSIITTGPLFHAQMVAADLGIGPVFGNEVLFSGNGPAAIVNGQVRAHIDLQGKGKVLAALQAELGISPAETIATGDGITDLPLFQLAAVAVAVCPSHPDVAAAADIVLSEKDLRPLLAQVQRFAPQLWP